MGWVFIDLLGWLPAKIQLLCAAIVALFFFFTLLHLVRFIWDLLPFT